MTQYALKALKMQARQAAGSGSRPCDGQPYAKALRDIRPFRKCCGSLPGIRSERVGGRDVIMSSGQRNGPRSLPGRSIPLLPARGSGAERGLTPEAHGPLRAAEHEAGAANASDHEEPRGGLRRSGDGCRKRGGVRNFEGLIVTRS